MNELDRYAVSLENMEVLRAQVEAQAREIERLSGRNCKVEDELARTLDYRALWVEASKELAALKSQPSGVVPDSADEAASILRNMIDSIGVHGNYSQESTLLFLNQALGCLDEVSRLNQPANAGDELTSVRCQCCQSEYSHDSYDAGFIAGSGMCQVCDAAMPPKDFPSAGDERAAFIRDFKLKGRVYYDANTHQWLPTRDSVEGFKLAQRVTACWVGWTARAALSANHSEQVRDFTLVTVEELALIIKSYHPFEPMLSIIVGDSYTARSGRRYMAATVKQIAAAPSVGSQREQE